MTYFKKTKCMDCENLTTSWGSNQCQPCREYTCGGCQRKFQAQGYVDQVAKRLGRVKCYRCRTRRLEIAARFAEGAIAAMLLLTLSGCEFLNGGADVEPEFKIIFSKFQEDAAKYQREISTGDLTLRFAVPEDHMDRRNQGECRAGKLILINRDYWSQIQDSYFGNETRELIVYHELGHCVLGQDHPKWNDPRGWNNIMNPVLRVEAYAMRREFYVEELFKFRSLVETVPAACELYPND